jgi:hypothetical protein
MLRVEFMIYPIDGLAKIKPLPTNVIPAPHLVRDNLQPESSKFKAFWMPDQVRHDDFGFKYGTINTTSCTTQLG